MKNVKVIGYWLLVMCMLLVGMPTMAQQQEWKSTSTMKGVGSTYSPQIQQVGAMSVPAMATTTTETYSPAKAPGRPRRESSDDPWGTNQDAGNTEDESSPIGDAVLPLLLMAFAFGGYLAIRRKQSKKYIGNTI